MGLRRWSIRLRIFLLVAIPILSLIGLYAFTATITAGSAINLARSRTVKDTVATPVGDVESALDAERITAVLYLAAPVPQNLAALQAEEHKTDLTVAGFKSAAATAAALGVLTPQPCIPATASPWTPGSPTVLIADIPALNNISTCMCMWAGIVTIADPGQMQTELP